MIGLWRWLTAVGLAAVAGVGAATVPFYDYVGCVSQAGSHRQSCGEVAAAVAQLNLGYSRRETFARCVREGRNPEAVGRCRMEAERVYAALAEFINDMKAYYALLPAGSGVTITPGYFEYLAIRSFVRVWEGITVAGSVSYTEDDGQNPNYRRCTAVMGEVGIDSLKCVVDAENFWTARMITVQGTAMSRCETVPNRDACKISYTSGIGAYRSLRALLTGVVDRQNRHTPDAVAVRREKGILNARMMREFTVQCQ